MSYPFSSPHQMSPLFPSLDRDKEELQALAGRVLSEAMALGMNTPPVLRQRLAEVLRPMNSYYTNKIEGQHTEPILIERALRQDYSEQPDEARRQRVAVAHIKTEKWLESAWPHYDAGTYFDEEVVWGIHDHLYSQLPIEDRMVRFEADDDGMCREEEMKPGQPRTTGVKVGVHIPPDPKNIPHFMSAWKEVYKHKTSVESALLALVASHHRLAWIHPFPDGNGRTARLHLHCGLHALGLTHGLWSVMRGLARQHAAYYAVLATADQARQGDYDGRGNLTEQGLKDVMKFILSACLDQIEFMRGVLSTDKLEQHFRVLLAAESQHPETGDLKIEAALPLMTLTHMESLERAPFKGMMASLSARTQDRVLSALLKTGLLSTDTPRGPVRLALPQQSFRYLFPRLWPEAEVTNTSMASAMQHEQSR